MNEHERIRQELRSLAGPTPTITVDSGAVLRAGRRRRATRAGAVTVATVLGVAGLAVGVAALPGVPWQDDVAVPAEMTPTPDPERTAEPAVPSASAVVDHQAGTVTLPLDEWTLSVREILVIEAARDLAVATCMAEAGYGEYDEFSQPDMPGALDDHGINSPYGVWVADEVREHGYSGTALLPYFQTERQGLALTTDAAEALDGCTGAAPRAAGLVDDRPRDETAPAPPAFTGDTDESQLIIGEWAACLRERGVEPPPEDGGRMLPGVPAGALDQPFDQQVRIGLIDVACKDELDVVQRLATIDAAEQVAYLDRGGRQYLEERWPVQQALLERATTLLADAGVVLGE